jgi:hypothetical protein
MSHTNSSGVVATENTHTTTREKKRKQRDSSGGDSKAEVKNVSNNNNSSSSASSSSSSSKLTEPAPTSPEAKLFKEEDLHCIVCFDSPREELSTSARTDIFCAKHVSNDWWKPPNHSALHAEYA